MKKHNITAVLVMVLGLATAILFCCGMILESIACGIAALAVAIVGLK